VTSLVCEIKVERGKAHSPTQTKRRSKVLFHRSTQSSDAKDGKKRSGQPKRSSSDDHTPLEVFGKSLV
jgi:hypothetical protein